MQTEEKCCVCRTVIDCFRCRCGDCYCPNCKKRYIQECSNTRVAGCVPECDGCANGTSQECPATCIVCKLYFCRRCTNGKRPFICGDCWRVTFPTIPCAYVSRSRVKCGKPSSHIVGRCKKHLQS